jgi:hypothetical protein
VRLLSGHAIATISLVTSWLPDGLLPTYHS